MTSVLQTKNDVATPSQKSNRPEDAGYYFCIYFIMIIFYAGYFGPRLNTKASVQQTKAAKGPRKRSQGGIHPLWVGWLVGWLVEVLLYVHRNRRFIRGGSPGRPPRLSHSFWAPTVLGPPLRLANTVARHGRQSLELSEWTWSTQQHPLMPVLTLQDGDQTECVNCWSRRMVCPSVIDSVGQTLFLSLFASKLIDPATTQ